MSEETNEQKLARLQEELKRLKGALPEHIAAARRAMWASTTRRQNIG